MNVKILIGAINEKGLGKMQKDFVYDVPDEHAKAYIANGWAEMVVGKTEEARDPATGNRIEESPSEESEGEGKSDEKDEKESKKTTRTRKKKDEATTGEGDKGK